MPDERKTEAAEVKEERKETIQAKLSQVGASRVGLLGVVLITAYLILLSIFLLYGLVQFWPLATQGGDASLSSSVTFLFWVFSISDEVRLLLIVALAGALGGLVHALRSLYWYVGHRELVLSWLLMFILLPFVGTTLALVFYFVVRGGFFSPQATIQQTSPFGFAALAGLVGLFSEQAVLKLKEVAEIVLAKPRPGSDAKPQERE